jgi:hypothetical protein
VFSTENGNSSINTQLLTKEAVVETKIQPAVLDSTTMQDEIVGGSIENVASIHKHLKQRFHRVLQNQHAMDNEMGRPLDRVSVSADEGMASGMSASGMSASGMKQRRRLHKHM